MSSIGSIEGGVFTSSAPVQASVDHYLALLGEPTISVDSGDGDRGVQWHETHYLPWLVMITGNASETIVSISKRLPQVRMPFWRQHTY